MSNSIDQRIVEMEFDNAQFEKGVATTIASLKKLDASLEIKDGVAGIKNIDKAISSVDFSSMASGISAIESRLSVLGTVGFTAIQRITNAAMDLGSSLLKAVTVQPLLDGMEEYNLQLDSLKTIQTNTLGKNSYEEIEAALERLNVYADKTIYSFAEMTKNIGTFTAAGVGLDDATDAIQGLSNVAAAAGVNAQRAANAMYQTSQALAIGKMTLIDWKSLEVAGLGGKMFQNELIDTAEHMGIAANAIIENSGTFRESLKEGWLTNDVLIETLRHFMYTGTEAERQHLIEMGYAEDRINAIFELANAANDAATKVKSFNQLIDTTKEALGTGWGTSWKLIIGDLNEASILWTRINDSLTSVIDGMSDARNNVLSDWHNTEWFTDEDGRIWNAYEALRETLFDILDIAGDLVAPLKEAFSIIFGDKEGQDTLGTTLGKITIGLHDTVHGIKEFIENSKTFQIVLTAVKIVATVLFGVLKALGMLIGGTLYVAITIVTSAIRIAASVIEAILSVIFGIVDSIASLNVMKVFEPVINFLESIEGFQPVVDFFKNLRTALVGVFDTTEDDATVFDKMNRFVELVGNGFGAGTTFAGGVFEQIGEAIGGFVDNARNKIFEKMPGILESIGQFASTNIAPILEKVGSAFLGFVGKIQLAAQTSGLSFEPILNFFRQMGDALGTFLNTVLDNGFSWEAIGTFFSTLWTALGDAAGTEGSQILAFFGELGGIAGGMFGSLGTWLGGLVEPLGQLIPLIGDFISQLTGNLGQIKFPWDSKDMVESSSNLSEISKNIKDASETIDNGNAVKILSGLQETITGFSGFASSFKSAVEMLKSPAQTISDFLSGGVNGIVEGINGFIDKLNSDKIMKLIGNLAKIGTLAGVMVGVKKFVDMMTKFGDMAEAIKGVASSIASIGDALGGIAKSFKKVVISTVILEIALAVVAMVAALYMLTTMNPERLDAVMPIYIGIIVGLGILLAAIAFISSKTNVIDFASMQTIIGVLVALSAAVLIMSIVIKRLGSLDFGTLIQGGLALTAFILILSLFVRSASKIKPGAFAGIGAIFLSIAAALAIVAGVMYLLGSAEDQDAIERGKDTVERLMAAMLVVTVALAVIGKKKLSGVKSLLVIAEAIAILAGVVLLFAAFKDSESINHSIISVLGLVIAIAALAVILNTIDSAGNVLRGAAAIMVMALGIGILAGAVAGLAAVQSMGMDTVVATAEIVVMLIALSGACAVLGALGPQMKAAVPAITALTIALALVSAVIVIFSQLDVAGVFIAIGQLAVAMVVLVGAFAVMAVVSKFCAAGLLVLSVFVDSIAMLALALAASFGIFALSLMDLSTLTPDAVKNITDSIGLLGQGLWEQREKIALGIMGIGYGIVSGILGIIPMIGVALLVLIGQILGVLIMAAPIVAEGAVQIIAGLANGLATGIEVHGPTLVNALMHLGEALAKGLWAGFSGIVGNFANWLYEVTNGAIGVAPIAHDTGLEVGESMANGLVDGTSGISDIIGSRKDEALATLTEMRDGAGEKSVEIIDAMKSGLESGDFKLSDLSAFDPREVAGVLGQLKANMSQGASSMMDGFNGAVDSGADLFGTTLSGFTDRITSSENPIGEAMNNLGIESLSEFGAGAEEGAAKVDLMNIVNETGSFDLEGIVDKFGSAGVLSADSYYEGFKNTLSGGEGLSLTSALEALSQEMQLTEVGARDGQALVNGMSTGLDQLAQKCSSAVSGAVSTVGRYSGTAFSQGYSVGANLGRGVMSGLSAYEALISAKAAAMVVKATAAMALAGVIRSPSRVTMKLGEYLGEGLVVGMGNVQTVVERTAGGMMASAVSTIETQAGYLDGLLDDIEENPVIRPVLDLDDYMMGINAMNSMLPNGQMALAGRIMGMPSVSNPYRVGDNNSATYNIDLNYTNDADANRIFSDLTREIRSKNLMEA